MAALLGSPTLLAPLACWEAGEKLVRVLPMAGVPDHHLGILGQLDHGLGVVSRRSLPPELHHLSVTVLDGPDEARQKFCLGRRRLGESQVVGEMGLARDVS